MKRKYIVMALSMLQDFSRMPLCLLKKKMLDRKAQYLLVVYKTMDLDVWDDCFMLMLVIYATACDFALNTQKIALCDVLFCWDFWLPLIFPIVVLL